MREKKTVQKTIKIYCFQSIHPYYSYIKKRNVLLGKKIVSLFRIERISRKCIILLFVKHKSKNLDIGSFYID